MAVGTTLHTKVYSNNCFGKIFNALAERKVTQVVRGVIQEHPRDCSMLFVKDVFNPCQAHEWEQTERQLTENAALPQDSLTLSSVLIFPPEKLQSILQTYRQVEGDVDAQELHHRRTEKFKSGCSRVHPVFSV